MSVNTGHVSWFKLAQEYKTTNNTNIIHAFFKVAMNRTLRETLKQNMNKNSNVNDIAFKEQPLQSTKQNEIIKLVTGIKNQQSLSYLITPIKDIINDSTIYTNLDTNTYYTIKYQEIDIKNLEQDINNIIKSKKNPYTKFNNILKLLGFQLKESTQDNWQKGNTVLGKQIIHYDIVPLKPTSI